ncbi:DUF4476 domain-containing protein [Phocaeicola sp.]
MKKMKQTLLILSMGIALSSCGNYMGHKSLMSVQKGMSREEITQLLGKPGYRRFDEQGEQWEYIKGSGIGSFRTIILVSFTNGKVSSFDSFEYRPYASPAPICPPSEVIAIDAPRYPEFHKGGRRISNDAFQTLYNKVKNKAFKEDRLEILATESGNYYFTCQQCARFMKLFTWDDDKMKVLEILAPRIADKRNEEVIIETFNSLFKKSDAKDMLRNQAD